MAEASFYKLKIQSKKQIAEGVWEFRLQKPAGFKQIAGQFAQFQIPTENSLILRSYSIASVPSSAYLEFCIKFVPGGKGSEYLERLQVGENVCVSQARGLFVCKESKATKYFVATGVGLAPIMAIIENCGEGEAIELLFGVRGEEDLFWVERLEGVRAKNKNFNYRITLSRGADDWTGFRGRVIEHLTFDKDGQYYLCGRMEMVKDVRNLLLKNGVNTKNVHFEIF